MPTGVQQTGASVKFGINQTFSGYIVQSLTRSKNPAVFKEIRNEQAQTVTVIHAGFDEEVQASLIVLSGTSEPDVGTVLTDGAAGEYLINAITVRESTEEAVVYDVTIKKYEGLDLTPGS